MARLIWVLAVALWGTCVAALATFDPADPPGHSVAVQNGPLEIANLIGRTGAGFSYEVFFMLGSGAWILALSLGAFLVHIAWRGPVGHPPIRLVGVAMLAIAFSCVHALFFPNWTSFPEGSGGLIGNASTQMLADRFGGAGAGILIFALAAIGATVAYDRWLIVVPAALGRVCAVLAGRAQTLGVAALSVAERARAARVRANDIDDDARLKRVEQAVKTAAKRTKRKKLNETIDEDAGGLGGAAEFDPNEEVVDEEDGYEYEDAEGEWEEEDAYEEEGDEEYEDEEDALPGAPQVFDKETLKEKISKLPVRFAGKGVQSAKDEDLDALREQRASEEEIDKNYAFPGLDLLEEPEENFNEEMEGYVREQAEALEQALQTYKIDGEVVGIESGPVITLYQVALAPGTKVSSLNSVASDIARMLKAVNVRIVANTEGLDTVGIEVPNQMKEKVRLKELMANNPKAAKMRLPLFLGKDASGTPLVVDLASLPHMLIAGTTGSGKSVCMNAIIMGFLYTQKPSDLKLVLVDPKMVELSQFKDIPHLMCPVVTEMSKAAAILEWAVTKMDERYELLAEAGCRDITAYNSLGWDELRERMNPTTELEEAKIPQKLPYMVFIIDELADLMMTNKEVESSIVRIAQKARAVGIHLILATQRPQANVVTGLIKSNMPGRLAFKVASGMDSRIVLDQKGGELLLGQGDMLMLTPRSSATMRAQGTLVDDSEIRNVVRFLRDHASSSFESQLVRIADHGLQATPEEHEENMRKAAQEDPLFDRAVELVLETRRGSVSMLQRRLAIGYTRSARLIEMMGEAGIIGDHKGTVAREVTMTLEEWQAMKELA
ncbi:MAG: DNA translocase FtsK, partial [Planctomycetota bacterium]